MRLDLPPHAVLLFALGVSAGCGSEAAIEPPATAPAATTAAVPARPPNIVLVSIDSLRPDHLGAYGYPKPTSPNLDRLAREGVVFKTAVSTTSWTLPAHAAMFTGLFDSAHGLVDNGLKLAPEHRTLAEALQSAGYRTAGFFGGPYLHPSYGVGQGFDVYQSCMTTIPDDATPQQVRALSQVPRGNEVPNVTGPRTIEEVTRWAADDDARPYFLFLHLFDVHYDYIPPPAYVKMFDPDYSGTLDAQRLPRNQAIHKGMAARDLQHLLALYDGEIRYTDDNLARIFAVLEERGMLENTLIAITADHGQEFFEHGGKGHQKTLYDEVLRVPMILHWPGRIEAGRVVEDQVRLVDLMPTLLAAAGVAPVAGVMGRDLAPLWRGETLEAAPALCELLLDKRDLRALRSESWKLVASPRNSLAVGFDLAADPGEQSPLAIDRPEVERGHADLARWLEAARTRARTGAADPREIEVDGDIEKRLEALGYIGDDDEPDEEPR